MFVIYYNANTSIYKYRKFTTYQQRYLVTSMCRHGDICLGQMPCQFKACMNRKLLHTNMYSNSRSETYHHSTSIYGDFLHLFSNYIYSCWRPQIVILLLKDLVFRFTCNETMMTCTFQVMEINRNLTWLHQHAASGYFISTAASHCVLCCII